MKEKHAELLRTVIKLARRCEAGRHEADPKFRPDVLAVLKEPLLELLGYLEGVTEPVRHFHDHDHHDPKTS